MCRLPTFLATFLLFSFQPLTIFSQQWKPSFSPLTTPWTKDVSSEKAWPEYPRPQMLRDEWMNLNGLWNFTLFDLESDRNSRGGKILVPFPVESALSGLGWKVEPRHMMVYSKDITIPEKWNGRHILLHFGAADWETEVYVNNKKVGDHKGGYDPFSFDITDFLTKEKTQRLSIQVKDPSDTGGQPVGKQSLNPRSIWYTATSGIWQTVWLEPVAEAYIASYRVEPDIDKGRAVVRVETGGEMDNYRVVVRVFEDGKILSTSTGKRGTPHLMSIPVPHLWSMEDPFLYDVFIDVEDPSGKVVDKVKGYFGMRKTSLGKDANGVTRLLLNNKFVFQLGPLDQGFWPDGLYTPPTEAAMKFDLETLKQMGFNMIRKHVKVEPDRWYYLCDKMGMLVWQDMPSAKNESSEDRLQFKWEMKAMVDHLFNHPSVVMWVPFNEGWGQHDTEFYVEQLKNWDPTRPVNNASGWTDKGVGDVLDIHDYPGPAAPKAEAERATVLGEFGGLGLNVRGHQWTNEGWGYQLIATSDELLARYEQLYRELLPMVEKDGLSAAVYTQVSDIETENNGLMTYDRKVMKIDPSILTMTHAGFIPPKPKAAARIFTKNTNVILESTRPDATIQYAFEDGKNGMVWQNYTAPIPMKKTTTFYTKATWPDGKQSRPEAYTFRKVKAISSKGPKKASEGIRVKIYDGSWDKLPDFKALQPVTELTIQKIGLEEIKREEDFGLVFEGWIAVPETGAYTIHLSTDDGSRLYIANQMLIEDDGLHGMNKQAASIALKKGIHPIQLEFFQKKGGVGLAFSVEGPGGELVPLYQHE
ncbi:MAG: PA14 domain-containing protein [Saprospiraceae bacterium]